MLKERNITVDVFKLISAYMVVFIHSLFYGRAAIIMDALARFAVPFFIVVSGYYSYQLSLSKIKKRIRHIFSLLVFSSILYTLNTIIPFIVKGDTSAICGYFENFLDIKKIFDLFFFSVPISSGHIWYLIAMLKVYIFFYLATKHNVEEEIILKSALLLLILHLFMGEFLLAFKISVSIKYVRNAILMCIPFFVIGMFIKKYETKFLKIPDFFIPIMLFFGELEALLSRVYIGKNELFIGSLLVVFAMVITFIKYPKIQFLNVFAPLADCSTYIYIIHIIVSLIVLKLYGVLGINYYMSGILQLLHPVWVCLISTIFAYIIVQLLKKAKRHR